ncbi:MAG: 4-hydroxythreonine-4-phosphate dehydrogenase PdxA, partial [Chitinophagaceae bacterium]
GITCGDINGIGPEIIIRMLSDVRVLEFCTPVIFGSNKIFNYYKKVQKNTTFNYQITPNLESLKQQSVNIINVWQEEVEVKIGIENEIGGKYAILSLLAASNALKEGKINALITAPLSKNNVQSDLFRYTGHTPFFRNFFQSQDAIMLMCSEAMKVALLTEHVSLKEVSQYVTKEKILSTIKTLESVFSQNFGIYKSKIAVLSLNPHAGDGGLIGTEEKNHIIPAIQEANEQGIYAFGPYSADGFFAKGHFQEFDVVLAMYHDQGLIPFKSTDCNRGINFTANMPVIRTSPDHGTAFDIAGQNKASEESIIAALFFSLKVLKNRIEYKKQRENPLEKQFSNIS